MAGGWLSLAARHTSPAFDAESEHMA